MRIRPRCRRPGAGRAGRCIALVALLVAAACGPADHAVPILPAGPATTSTTTSTTTTSTAATTTTSTTTTVIGANDLDDGALVAALDVTIVGSLTPGQRALVRWALGRFDDAGLLLPARIAVGFEPGPAACGWSTGRCQPDLDPPEVRVCALPGSTFFRLLERRMTLLHELTHVWHWAHGDGETWLDLSAVLDGDDGHDTLPTTEPIEERVAAVITWGLLDQPRRAVPTELTCAELFRQFYALTGHEPLGPIEAVCMPSRGVSPPERPGTPR